MLARARISRTVSVGRETARVVNALNAGEEGHAIPLFGTVISGIGTIALGIGAANDTGWLAITGGIVAFVGAVATVVLNHTKVEYAIFARLDALEGKK